MRTPNASCIICAIPLYRRPSDLAKARYVACFAHREIAKRQFTPTAAQLASLSLGRTDNHRLGYTHRQESKLKTSESYKRWCADNPDKVEARSAKRRGHLAYNWNGGSTRLNVAIRQMRNNREWIEAIKRRDGACLRCGSTNDLEAHHKVELAALIAQLGVQSTADARKHKRSLFDLENGETLCRRCHYQHHGRAFNEAA